MVAVLSARGQLERLRGDHAAALEAYEQASAIVEASGGAETMEAAILLSNRASLSTTLRREIEATDLFAASLAIREAILGSNSPELVETLNDYAFALRRLKRVDEAEAVEARAEALTTP